MTNERMFFRLLIVTHTQHTFNITISSLAMQFVFIGSLFMTCGLMRIGSQKNVDEFNLVMFLYFLTWSLKYHNVMLVHCGCTTGDAISPVC